MLLTTHTKAYSTLSRVKFHVSPPSQLLEVVNLLQHGLCSQTAVTRVMIACHICIITSDSQNK